MNNKFDFTPGMLEIQDDTELERFVIFKNEDVIAELDYISMNKKTQKANANLFAAAPEMIEALIEDVKFFEKQVILFAKDFSESYFKRCVERNNYNKSIVEKALNKKWSEINE